METPDRHELRVCIMKLGHTLSALFPGVKVSEKKRHIVLFHCLESICVGGEKEYAAGGFNELHLSVVF